MLKSQEIFDHFSSRKGQIAVLVDPEKSNSATSLSELIKKATFANVDYFFVGGSTVTREDFLSTVQYIKENSSIPLIIFPGSSHQISEEADALLYLSLISGRNPDYLIGHHVASAHEVYDMDIEIISTAYILVEGGNKSSVAYVSQTIPIPSDKSSIILNTAKAGLLQGKRIIYTDAGSGATSHVPAKVIHELSQLNAPVIVGGGIRSKEQIDKLASAGANVIVIGNKIEEDIDFLIDIKTFIENAQ
ncbi:MAG: geranylgeranylglyceryl/heptaprenylglyceryl phosphate synthase [Crocinitomicaceae bacterium]|nr:geranylgeranylglyceryl/heptaprenylglyceryl phosphate synthase [Crocinitomicaceae bacterium]